MPRFTRMAALMLAFLLIAGLRTSAQVPRKGIAIAFYNCENFFDTKDNPAKEDDDFTPSGKYHYTQKIYEQKLHNIATVLQSMEGPALIGLAEVENTTVLSDLVRQPEIARSGYKYLWFDGPDQRGINVALLYDPRQFTLIKAEPLRVDLSKVDAKAKTRDVLLVNGVLYGDTVFVSVNHWPSKRGSEEMSDNKRLKAAEAALAAIRRIRVGRLSPRIIVMGDFNDSPVSKGVKDILVGGCTAFGLRLYNPFEALFLKGEGTEVYQHNWNLIDQVIISQNMVGQGRGLRYKDAIVYKPAFLIDRYKGHEGEPKRSFAGTRWINGYSDHFPVILYLSKN